MSGGSHRNRATWRAIAPLVAVMAALMAFASVAFACTAVMGQLLLSPTSGPPGQVVSTSATGIKVAPAQYALHFAKTTYGDCMSFSGVVTVKTIATDASGAWSNVRIRIPTGAKLGTHAVCGMEIYPIKGSTGTTHESFTVT